MKHLTTTIKKTIFLRIRRFYARSLVRLRSRGGKGLMYVLYIPELCDPELLSSDISRLYRKGYIVQIKQLS